MTEPTNTQNKPNPRPVRVDEETGFLYELTGERIVIPGLEPNKILAGLEDEKAGRLYPLDDLVDKES